MPSSSKKPRKEHEKKKQETFESRFALLNQPRDPKKEISVPSIPCPPIKTSKRSQSAPADLVHDPIKQTYTKVITFCKEEIYPKPNIFLTPILTYCQLKQLYHANSSDQVKELFEIYFQDEFKDFESRSKNVFINLLVSTFFFCKSEKFKKKCTIVTLNIFYHTHKFFLASPWRTADEVYNYLKEFILLHTVMDPPESTKIFTPYQGQRAIIEFCKLYMRYLPLIRTLGLPNYRLKLTWPIQEETHEPRASHISTPIKS